MKQCILALLFIYAVQAQAAVPSDQSIDELFAAMNLKGTLDVMLANMDQSIKSGMQQGLQQQGKDVTPEQGKQLDQPQQKLSATLRDEFSYDKMREIYRKAYRTSFSQEEINGLIAFFKSAAGKALHREIARGDAECIERGAGKDGPPYPETECDATTVRAADPKSQSVEKAVVAT
jgi:hypothetical protein